MKILAIESSCDETAAAVVEDGVRILTSVVASSHDMHEKYGGIVPEVAARKQLESIIPVIQEASGLELDDIDALAVAVGPGLIGSLLVGVETAKTMAYVSGKPIIPVNHVLAHMYANFIPSNGEKSIQFPAISLVVSGGHTELYLMESPKRVKWLGGTLDDAAGECFDKTARLLGFGHGGGVAIQTAASKTRLVGGSPIKRLPRPMLDKHNELNFSFSGLKTAILREVNQYKTENRLNEMSVHYLAFEVQEAITDVLVNKTLKAAEKYSATSILLSGGVSANLRLREKFMIHDSEFRIHAPPIHLCTDNAVYIASYAYFRGVKEDWKTIEATPDLSVEVLS